MRFRTPEISHVTYKPFKVLHSAQRRFNPSGYTGASDKQSLKHKFCLYFKETTVVLELHSRRRYLKHILIIQISLIT